MKLASKVIAAMAVMACFSSFAEPIDNDTLSGLTDLAGAVDLAGDGNTSAAAILQTGGTSFASIDQTGTNAAVILQTAADSRAAIVQSNDNNIAIIYQH